MRARLNTVLNTIKTSLEGYKMKTSRFIPTTHRTFKIATVCKSFGHQIDYLIEKTGYVTIQDLISMIHHCSMGLQSDRMVSVWYDGLFHVETDQNVSASGFSKS
jgi:hypothetical protein